MIARQSNRIVDACFIIMVHTCNTMSGNSASNVFGGKSSRVATTNFIIVSYDLIIEDKSLTNVSLSIGAEYFKSFLTQFKNTHAQKLLYMYLCDWCQLRVRLFGETEISKEHIDKNSHAVSVRNYRKKCNCFLTHSASTRIQAWYLFVPRWHKESMYEIWTLEMYCTI